jgi:hypothetical protein
MKRDSISFKKEISKKESLLSKEINRLKLENDMLRDRIAALTEMEQRLRVYCNNLMEEFNRQRLMRSV